MRKEYAEYLLDKTQQDYNAIADQFSSTRRFIWKGLEPLYYYASPEDRVLDLGCGNGRLLQIFKEIEIDYTGVDGSDKLVEIARKTYPNNNFQVANALRLPFPNDYFDKVFSVAVLHHIPSVELRLQFLQEAKRVLRRDGLLILTVWDLWQWKLFFKFTLLKLSGMSKLDLKDVFVPWSRTCQRYIHCFHEKELKELVKKTGLKIKETGILKIKEGGESNIYIVAQK